MADEPRLIPLEQVSFHADTVQVVFDDEEFRIIVVSGNLGRSYFLSPKHAKRLLLLLQQRISEYEDRFGELQTSLPQATDQTGTESFGFDLSRKSEMDS